MSVVPLSFRRLADIILLLTITSVRCIEDNRTASHEVYLPEIQPDGWYPYVDLTNRTGRDLLFGDDDSSHHRFLTTYFSEDWTSETVGSWIGDYGNFDSSTDEVYPSTDTVYAFDMGRLVLNNRGSCREEPYSGVYSQVSITLTLAQGLYHVEADVAQQSTLWDFCESGSGSGSAIRIDGRDVASMGTGTPFGSCTSSAVDSRRLAGDFSVDTPGNVLLTLITVSGDCALTLTYWDNIVITEGAPSASPSFPPSFSPSSSPSFLPSTLPSATPSASAQPSSSPSALPSTWPSISPSGFPSVWPSTLPSVSPSLTPSLAPTSAPSKAPSSQPSKTPSRSPSQAPSRRPSASPSRFPTATPSVSPSRAPSALPSARPSKTPSASPSRAPSRLPSASPSAYPTPSRFLVDQVQATVTRCVNKIFKGNKCSCINYADNCIFQTMATQCPLDQLSTKEKKSFRKKMKQQILIQCLLQKKNRQRTSVPTFSPSNPPSYSSAAPSYTPRPSSTGYPSATPSQSPAPTQSTNRPTIDFKANVKKCLTNVMITNGCDCTSAGWRCLQRADKSECYNLYIQKDDKETFLQKTKIAFRRRCPVLQG